MKHVSIICALFLMGCSTAYFSCGFEELIVPPTCHEPPDFADDPPLHSCHEGEDDRLCCGYALDSCVAILCRTECYGPWEQVKIICAKPPKEEPRDVRL